MSQETKPKHNHLSLTTLRRALHQTEESLEARQSVWHMLETCEVCRQAEPLIYQSFEAGLLPLDASLPEIETLVLEARGACRWRAIAGDGGPWETLRGDERLADWGVVVHLAEESLREEEPAQAARLAELAAAGALRLDDDDPAPQVWNRVLEAFTHAVWGDALRRAGRLAPAQGQMGEAQVLLARLGDDGGFLPFMPRIWQLYARLRADQQRWDDALALLDRAIEMAGRVEIRADPELPARLEAWRRELLETRNRTWIH